MSAQVERTLPAMHGNAGVHAWYEAQLDKAIKQMHESLVYWLLAAYKAQGLAQDGAGDGTGNPAVSLNASVSKLGRRWQRVFNALGESLARGMTDRVLAHTDNALGSQLRGEGLSVKFTMSEPMREAYQAVIGENVGLIKSIASQHLSEVQGLVMRSVARGRDAGSLAQELQKRYAITKRRAALIARDQNNKATTTLQAARQQSIGITEGIWKHSHAGRVPRPSHVKADGQRFDLKKGLELDGEWVMPGEEINCRCTWQPVIAGFSN